MNIIRLNSIGEPFAKSGQATPPSGGGTEGGSDIIYIDMTGYENYTYPSLFSDCIKLNKDEQTLYMGPADYAKDENNAIAPIAISVNLNKRVNFAMGGPVGEMVTFSEIVTTMGMGDVLDLPRITKEQFYTL